MNTAHRVFSVLTALLGVVHVAFTPVFYPKFGISAMWFIGTGLSLLFLAVANWVFGQADARTGRGAVAGANILGLIYITVLAVMLKEPQGFLGCVFALGLLVCGLVRPGSAARSGTS